MPLRLRKKRLVYRKYLQELYEKKQARVYSGVILTFLTISFFVFFALRPTFLTIASLVAEIKQKEETSKKLDAKIQQIAQAQASYSQVAPKLYLVDEALPVELSFSFLVENLEIGAGQNQVNFSDLSFEKVALDENKEGSQKIDFKTSLKGQFGQLKDFFDQIFSLRRIIQGSQLALTKSKEEISQSLVLSAQMTSFFMSNNADH